MSISSGSGKVDYALVIAGAPDIWVTSTRLEQTLSDGRVIRAGLQYQGLRIREEVHLKDAELDVSGISFRIVHERALAAFAKRATQLGVIREDWTSGTTIDTDDLSVSPGDLVHINTACYEVSSFASPTLTTTTAVDAPLRDTLPQYHYHLFGARSADAPVFDAPGSYEGRRVYLYRFDATETWSDASGSAPYYATEKTPIWRGVIRQAPRLDSDGLTWMVETDSIVELLRQSMAAAEGPIRISGATYYWHCPFFIWVRVHELSASQTVESEYVGAVIGGTASEDGLRNAINDELDSMLSGVTTIRSLRCRTDGRQLFFELRTPASDPRYVDVYAGSYMDGVTNFPVDDDDNDVAGMSADSRYRYKLRPLSDDGNSAFDLGRPRAYLSASRPRAEAFEGVGARWASKLAQSASAVIDNATRDTHRLFLDSQLPASSTSDLETIFVQNAVASPRDEYHVLAIDNTGRSIDLAIVTQQPLVLDGNSEVSFARGVTAVEGLKEFRQHIIDQSIKANFGDTPFVTSRDLASWDVWDEIAETDAQLNRSYVYRDATELWEVLRNEALFLSAFFRLESDGTIGLAGMELPDVAGADLTSIDTTNTVSPYGGAGAWPTWEPGGDGIVNEVEVILPQPVRNTGGQAGDEETVYTFRLVEAIGVRKSRGRGHATIELKSTSPVRAQNPADIAAAIAGYLSIMSTDYQRVTIPVTFDLFDVKVGDYVLVSNPHIPNAETGERGITNKQGLVVARDWPLDPAERAYGELTVLLLDVTLVAGYAPTFYYNSASDQGGGVWRFTPGQTTFPAMWSELWPTNVDVSDLWQAGDTVVIRPLSSSGSNIEGTLDSIQVLTGGTTGQLDVDIGTTPPSEGLIEFVRGDSASSVSDHQGQYAYVADSTGKLYSGRTSWRFA